MKHIHMIGIGGSAMAPLAGMLRGDAAEQRRAGERQMQLGRGADRTQVLDALKLMAGNDVNQLPVVANGTLQGILSRSHLMQLLHARAELRLPAAHYPRLQHR